MTLTIATWNVLAKAHYEGLRDRFPLRYPPATSTPEDRRRRTLAEIRRLVARSSVVCLEEAEPELVGELQVSLGEGFDVVFAPRPASPDRPRGPDGVAIACRRGSLAGSPSIHEFSFAYRVHRPDGSIQPDHARRVAILARIPSPRGPINLLATHVEWDDGHGRLADGRSIGTHQAERLLDLLEASPSSLDIIAGDLNSEPGDPCLSRLESAGFRAAAEPDGGVARPTGLVWSAPSLNARAVSTDWILVRGGTATLGARIAVPNRAPSEEFPSDHFPLEATVTFDP